MGNFNPTPIVSNTCLTNMIYFVTSDKAMYSDSVNDSDTLLLAFDFQDIKATQKYEFHLKTLMRVS
jgi:hypothetical protein